MISHVNKLGTVRVGGSNPVRIMGILNASPESFYKKSISIGKQKIVDAVHSIVFEGADFKNAFAHACRTCINQVFGCEFLPKFLYLDVKVNNSSSDNHCSYTGTGAGRPSGGQRIKPNIKTRSPTRSSCTSTSITTVIIRG
jgi:hypothetical protein